MRRSKTAVYIRKTVEAQAQDDCSLAWKESGFEQESTESDSRLWTASVAKHTRHHTVAESFHGLSEE